MTLSHEETLRQAVEAYEQLKSAGSDDYRNWIKIGRGLALLRDDAARRSHNRTGKFYNKLMGDLLEQHGLRGDGPLKDKAVRSRLLDIIDNYSKVHAWRETLPLSQKLLWNHPTTIWRKCPVFRKPGAAADKPPTPSPMAKLKASLVDAEEKLQKAEAQLNQAGSGSNIDFEKDSLPDIAQMIAGSLVTASRIRQVIKLLSKKAKLLERDEPSRHPIEGVVLRLDVPKRRPRR
jgi:hypothetical protein